MAKPSKHKSDSSSNSSSTDGNSNVAGKVRRTRKSVPRESPQRRSSIFRGVTRHRWTGRYEAHLWDKNCWNESQNKKGRQVYLGAYDDEEAAAHAYDLAALKYWGHETILNFPLSTYENELREMDVQSKEEYIGSLRRKSSGFSRGVSKYRGVARHHHNGRWEARIGRVFGNKYLYLGTYATQEEAAAAYDMAAIEYRGLNAITNFDLSNYIDVLQSTQNPNEVNASMENPNQELGFDFVDSNYNQESSGSVQTGPPAQSNGEPTAASSALGVLLQSNKFKEMLACNNGQLVEPLLEPTELLQSSSFPDDIQTSFDIQDSSGFAEAHDDVFENYDEFITPLINFGLDA